MTYSNAPDLPTEIGDQWTNPDTGVEYEWNGERWVIVGSANFDSKFIINIALITSHTRHSGLTVQDEWTGHRRFC